MTTRWSLPRSLTDADGGEWQKNAAVRIAEVSRGLAQLQRFQAPVPEEPGEELSELQIRMAREREEANRYRQEASLLRSGMNAIMVAKQGGGERRELPSGSK